MDILKRCVNCAYFCETIGLCGLHDRDVTRFNGCGDHMTIEEMEDKAESEEAQDYEE